MIHAKEAFELSRKRAAIYGDINKCILKAADYGHTSTSYIVPSHLKVDEIAKMLIEKGYDVTRTVFGNAETISIGISWKLRY